MSNYDLRTLLNAWHLGDDFYRQSEKQQGMELDANSKANAMASEGLDTSGMGPIDILNYDFVGFLRARRKKAVAMNLFADFGPHAEETY